LHANSIGGFISQADLALSLLNTKGKYSPGKYLNFFVLSSSHANSFIVEQYREIISAEPGCRIFKSNSTALQQIVSYSARGMEHLAIQNPKFRNHYCGSPTREGLDANGFFQDGRPRLKLSESQVDEGWQSLKVLGLNPNQRIICFNARDSQYWDSNPIEPLVGGGGSTQDFRNVDIENYLPALRELVLQGFTVVRMGNTSNRSDLLSRIGVIDYANSNIRSDFLDVLLFSNCNAAIFGGASGIAHLALAFHKPVCVMDYRPFISTEWSTPVCQVTPSLMRYLDSGSILTLKEMMKHPFNVGESYTVLGIEFVPNTPDEILLATLEFLAAISSEKPNLRKSELQRQFWRMVHKHRPNYAYYPRTDGKALKFYSRYDPMLDGKHCRTSTVSEYFLDLHAIELFRKVRDRDRK